MVRKSTSGYSVRCRGQVLGGGPHLLHVRVEARSSLYLWTDSSLNRVFTLLMWVARWILDRQQSRQITEEARANPSPRADGSRPPGCPAVVLTSQTCGFARRYIATLRREEKNNNNQIPVSSVKEKRKMQGGKDAYCRSVCLYGNVDGWL